MSRRVRVKICCIASREEARLAIALGADALGLVSAMPSGPGVIEDGLIADIARSIPPGVSTFLLTSEVDPGAIVGQIRAAGVNTVQLVDSVQDDVYAAIRLHLPCVRIVQVVHVADPESRAHALRAVGRVDALLLDSGVPRPQPGAPRELGGTGRVHDWAQSAAIVTHAAGHGVAVWLAGGLNANNAREAISRVAPFGLDVCSGVRSNGRLDEARLASFMDAVRA